MGRHNKALPAGNRALGQLAAWLREQRSQAELREQRTLTYRELAKRAKFHHSTLSRAANGEHLPTLAVVEAYAQACEADAKIAQKLWRNAKHYHHLPGLPGARKRTRPFRPQNIDSFSRLIQAMQDMRRSAGQPPLRVISERAAEHDVRLPISTLSLILRNRGVLHRHQFLAYLYACGVSPKSHPQWMAAWDRANARSSGDPLDVSDLIKRTAITGKASPELLLRVLGGLHTWDK